MPNKQRLEERQQARQQAQRQQKLRTYLIVGGIAVAVLILVGALLLFTSNSNNAAATNNTPVTASGTALAFGTNGCTNIIQQADAGRNHISSPIETPTYMDILPTSGTHNPVWQTAGIYPTTQDLTMLVHSLEHGYIVIYHRDLSQDEYLKLVNFARSDAYKMIVNPYAKSPSRVALTAWDNVQYCNVVNTDVIAPFVAQFRDQGPEKGAQ